MIEAVDHDRLTAEIDAEVRRRRESGDLPADFERELDLVFARFAPVDALGGDFQGVLTRAEQATFVDVMAPVESARPGVSLLKKVVRRAVVFEVQHVAAQISAFAHAVTRAVKLLGERVEGLEQAAPAAGGRTAADARAAAVPLDVAHWAPMMAAAVAAAPGRVVHAEAGDGALVSRLLEAGADAYGVEPLESLAAAAVDAGLEVRLDDALAHLKNVPAGALGAVVLSGCVDRLALGALVDLADLASAAVAPGGTVAVISVHPVAWAAGRSGVEADLSPGRPLRAATWEHLLATRGLSAAAVYAGPPDDGLQAVGDAAVDANLERLNTMLFPPPSYAVVATRPT